MRAEGKVRQLYGICNYYIVQIGVTRQEIGPFWPFVETIVSKNILALIRAVSVIPLLSKIYINAWILI